MLSANSGHVRVAELLLKHGAAVDFRDGFGGTALMFAAGLGHTHVLHLLLQHGAEVNRRDHGGTTALIAAAPHGRRSAVLRLLRAGADVAVRDNDEKTALQLATENGCAECVEAFRTHLAEVAAGRSKAPTAGSARAGGTAAGTAAGADAVSGALLAAVRALKLAEPALGVKPLLAKLRAQQPELAVGSKEVRDALSAISAERAADKGAPSHEAPSLACAGCARLPSEMGDGRKKHPVCPKCVEQKLPTTYFCGVDCPANPAAWQQHAKFHKDLSWQRKRLEDGGVGLAVLAANAEGWERDAARSGDSFEKLMAEAAQYRAKGDWRRAVKVYRDAILLRPDDSEAYFALGCVLDDSGHEVEAAQRYLEAKERDEKDGKDGNMIKDGKKVGSPGWAKATALAFDMLRLKVNIDTPKPDWWSDKGLKKLSKRVVRAAPNGVSENVMRAAVLSGGERAGTWDAEPRSAAELREAAEHYERAAELTPAPAVKEHNLSRAGLCRGMADSMSIPAGMAAGELPWRVVDAAGQGEVGLVAAWLEIGGAMHNGKDLQVVNIAASSVTLLMAAARGGHEELVEMLLLDYGADVDQRSHKGYAALQIAAAEGHEQVVGVLLRHGADINLKAFDGFTALMTAADNDRPETLRCLLRCGADVKAENRWRETALRIAKRKGHSACVEILKEPPPPPPRPLP